MFVKNVGGQLGPWVKERIGCSIEERSDCWWHESGEEERRESRSEGKETRTELIAAAMIDSV